MIRVWMAFQSISALGNVAVILYDGGAIYNYLALIAAALIAAIVLRRQTYETKNYER